MLFNKQRADYLGFNKKKLASTQAARQLKSVNL